MSSRVSVVVHDIEADGLPDMTELVGRVAFITEGVIVSGWPLIRGPKENRWEVDVPGSWPEACSPPPIQGVTHWVEFPVPVEELTGG